MGYNILVDLWENNLKIISINSACNKKNNNNNKQFVMTVHKNKFLKKKKE